MAAVAQTAFMTRTWNEFFEEFKKFFQVEETDGFQQAKEKLENIHKNGINMVQPLVDIRTIECCLRTLGGTGNHERSQCEEFRKDYAASIVKLGEKGMMVYGDTDERIPFIGQKTPMILARERAESLKAKTPIPMTAGAMSIRVETIPDSDEDTKPQLKSWLQKDKQWRISRITMLKLRFDTTVQQSRFCVDSGSQMSLISEADVKRLDLKPVTAISVQGVNGKVTMRRVVNNVPVKIGPVV
ncbi:hypothetical protein BGZ81_000542, partial [Podila clonocystis]